MYAKTIKYSIWNLSIFSLILLCNTYDAHSFVEIRYFFISTVLSFPRLVLLSFQFYDVVSSVLYLTIWLNLFTNNNTKGNEAHRHHQGHVDSSRIVTKTHTRCDVDSKLCTLQFYSSLRIYFHLDLIDRNLQIYIFLKIKVYNLKPMIRLKCII